MTYTKISTAQSLLKRYFNCLNSNSRNKRRYTISMLPGKRFDISIPIKYLIRHFNLEKELGLLADKILTQGKLKVNGYVVKDNRFPVSVLDIIEYQRDGVKMFKRFIYCKNLNREQLLEVQQPSKCWSCKGYKVKNDNLLVQNFQGKHLKIPFTKENLDMLRKPGSYLVQSQIKNAFETPELFYLVKLKGRNIFNFYQLVSSSKFDAYYYRLTLRDPLDKKEKIFYLKNNEFMSNYAIIEKEGIILS